MNAGHARAPDNSPAARPWRVLQLASTSDMGGTERMILFLVEAIDRARFSCSVAALVGGGELLSRAKPHCSDVRHLHFGGQISLGGTLALARYMRAEGFDLVQTYGLRADLAGRIAGWFAGVQVIVSSIRSIDPWRRWYHVLLDRATSRLAALYISNSEAGRQAAIARERLSPSKVRVVYSGIPQRPIPIGERDDVRRQLALAAEDFPVIVILANLREMKGHRDVVEALPAILKAYPAARFVFAGRDDSRGGIEQLARERGVHDAIRFIGYYADTPRLLAASDIFMLPSHWEGLPVSVIEAMHAGMPIITTKVGGIPELVAHESEALLIDPAAPDQIATSVLRLADDPALRQALGTQARARAQGQFSISAMTRRIEAIYSELLSGHGMQETSSDYQMNRNG